MDSKLMTLANSANRYAFEHDLPMPSFNRENIIVWSKAVSDAVEHANDHPDLRYAKSLIRADNAFARTRTK